jgi:hypothetical protein
MNLNPLTRSRTIAVLVGASALAVAGTTGAVASSLVTSHDIKDHTIQSVDLGNGAVTHRVIRDGAVRGKDLSESLMNRVERGAAGHPPLDRAYYSVAFYDVGDTNAGAIATVACKKETDTAITGGVQVTGIGVSQDEINAANQRNTPVSSSFPGRMDWTTNSPKPQRLDGWIVQFGGNAGQTSDKAPEKVKIWALCVPGLDIPVHQTYTESSD